MKNNRHILTLMVVAGIVCPLLLCQPGPLSVERQGSQLRVTAPQLHFLEGKPLEQLRNGAAVTYVFSLALTSDHSVVYRVVERFIVSYDLWEEKYSIVHVGRAGHTGSHLTAPMAEAWCLENIPVPVPALPAEKPFVIRLECSVAIPEGENSESRPGLTLAGLIDVFSRKDREAPLHWEAVSGSMRLGEVKDRKSPKH